jgi:tripartite-type tricarboxylate transporter receptor subunit TctC
LGYPYLNFVLWVGVFAPAGLPQPVLDVLVPAVAKTLKDPEVLDRASAINLMVDYMGPEEFRKFLESEIRIVEKIVQDVGLKGK